MRIKKVTDEAIIFDNNKEITFDHPQDCCEYNYADFSILTPNVVNYDYDFDENLEFEMIPDLGFKFGSNERWIFIPCYSEQNGYYTTEIDIYFGTKRNPKEVLCLDAQFIEC